MMTSTDAAPEKAVEDYLGHLDRALRDISKDLRLEITSEIRSHIAEARAEGELSTEADARSLLERLGPPEEIAADARERSGIELARPGGLEMAALILLLIGGVVVPILGWVVGVVLLWSSSVWTTKDKLIGTFVVPGGLAPAAASVFLSDFTRVCVTGPVQVVSGGHPAVHCSSGASTLLVVGSIVAVVALVVLPIGTTVYLRRKLQRRSAQLAMAAGT